MLCPHSAEPAYLVILRSECTYEYFETTDVVRRLTCSTVPGVLGSLRVVDAVLTAKCTVC